MKFTMNLNWSAQFEATREALKKLTSSMLSSYATTTQKLRTINTCLRTKVRYAFCVAPYTNGQIQMLDSILCRAVKQAYGLPTCMSNAAVHEDVNRGGLGSPSLLTEYATVQVQRLTAALNDTGPLGALSRVRMQQEKCLLDKTTAAAHPALAQHSMRLRQQLACVRVNIELRKDQTEILSMDSVNPLIQELATISEHSTATANAVLEGIHTPDPPPLLILDLYHLYHLGSLELGEGSWIPCVRPCLVQGACAPVAAHSWSLSHATGSNDLATCTARGMGLLSTCDCLRRGPNASAS